MPIFKSRWGGYYTADHKNIANDVQMVRKASVSEVKELLDFLDPHNDVSRGAIERVLMTLDQLTPDGTDRKAWKELHNV